MGGGTGTSNLDSNKDGRTEGKGREMEKSVEEVRRVFMQKIQEREARDTRRPKIGSGEKRGKGCSSATEWKQANANAQSDTRHPLLENTA